MTLYRVGETDVADRRIRRSLAGKDVPTGTKGKVIKAPLVGQATVEFRRWSAWSGERVDHLAVDGNEIRKA